MKHSGLIIFLFCFLLSFASYSQKPEKKPITTNDFASWKVLNNPIISSDGKYSAYEINPQKGDGKLVVKAIEQKKEDSIPRGYSAMFSPEADFIIYKIKQPEDSIRDAKKRKIKKELMPKDSIGIYVFKRHKKYAFPNLKQFALPKENAKWIAFLTDMQKQETKMEEKKKGNKKNEELPFQLILFQASTGDTVCFKNVTELFVAPLGQTISFIRQIEDSVDRTELISFNTELGKATVLFKQNGTAKKIATDQQGNRYGFLFSADTTKEKVYGLYFGTLSDREPKNVVTTETKGIPVSWSPSEYSDLSFSDNGSHLFFGTNKKPGPEPEDSLLDDEKPILDIWSWTDKELQPEQKKNLEKEKKRTFKAVYLTENDKFVQLADPTMRDIQTIQKGNGTIALGWDNSPYKLQSSWTGNTLADYYIVDIETGERRLSIKSKSIGSLSPGGNFVTWYDPMESSYFAKSTLPDKTDSVKLNDNIPVRFFDEQWDMPSDASPYGIAGWSENDKFIFIYDRFDIWRIDPTGEKVPVNATRNYGRKNSLVFRYEKLNPEEEFIDTNKPVIVSVFDEKNKSAGFFSADLRNYTDPKMLFMEDARFSNLQKAKKAETLIWTSEDVDESPNLWTSDLAFEQRHQLSDTNPQQKNFVWPVVRLVQWTSFSGKPLEGLLYYPETIDPDRKYPMVVYFYERNAENLHTYFPPAPTRSTVNRTYFTSNDYIVFVPDITYENGYPGQSAFDAVVSGTQFVCNLFAFADRNKIGIQGQSWGGYQVAWLITQTKMFAAAMAGAPVSNMTSAYGGIRWESGLVREFQYEKTQSRIGGTLWDKPLQFIENSPLFYVPKIETPLLIMHNDNDGAVPWYQGIELFTALRRLQKPVWMLTYNNEEHNLKAGPTEWT